MEDDVEDLTDHISQVPEFIIHHIMSFLKSPKDLVRMSVLSKNLFSLTASFPNLDLDMHKVSEIISVTRFKEIMSSGTPNLDLEALYTRQSFLQYVLYTTFRFCKQNVTRGHTLKLITELQDPTILDLTYRCLALILMKGVQMLEIDITDRNPMFFRPVFRLPDILLSVSSLTSLKLCNCELPSSLMVYGVKFKSLKLLCLEYLHLDEKVINILTTSCRLLEELTVGNCYGFKRFCVFGLKKLQIVKFWYEHGVESINIEAPNLCSLLLSSSHEQNVTLRCVNVASCRKLTTLHYSGYPFPASDGFSDLLSHFPFLENLFLHLPDECNSLKLSSHSLRTLVLRSECDLEDIDMKTPNLRLFQYKESSCMFGSMFTNPVPLKPCMTLYSYEAVDSLLFKSLRRFLDKNIQFKEVKLRIWDNDIDVFEELKLIQSTPYELEHVQLDRDMEEVAAYLALVEAILWCCCPQSLTLILKSNFCDSFDDSFDEFSDIVKFTSEKLLQQEDEGIINIRIEMSWSSKVKKQFSDINSLFAALLGDQQVEAVTFVKEVVSPSPARMIDTKGLA